MKKMYLGVAREDITPEVGGALFGYTLGIYSEKISDPLNLTSFAFSSGETKVIMINATICVICVAFCEEIKREVSARTGVPFENIIVSATHTHTGPSLADSADGWFSDVEYYRNIFLPAAISASCKAVANMQPVRVGIATGQSFAGVNRRQLTLDNEVILGQNPWAPFNTEMTFLSFRNYDGDTVANIVSY
ncbi:MAG: hypothetical protein II350_08370, partial [Clostridia bacterium]|nr:hypothetical protein [Clostridia bacterium]